MIYFDRRPVTFAVPETRERELLEPWTFRDQHGREWTIPAGHRSDGASIPTVVGLAWAVLGSKHDPRLEAASRAHDWLCEERPDELPSSDAHELFRLMAIADTVPRWSARAMHRGICIGGPDW